MALINTEIKPFTATAYKSGEFVDVSDADLKGKWSVVFFYPADFTFVCPTELGDLADQYADLKALDVEVYSVSTDTHFTHKAWHDTSDTIGKIDYFMIGDPTTQISPELRGPPRGSGPGRPRHLRHRPRRRDPGPRDHRRGRRPQRGRARPQGQGRPVRRAPIRARSARPSGKRATTPSPPASTSSARSDATPTPPFAGPIRDLPRPPIEPADGPSDRPPPDRPTTEPAMLDANLTAQLTTHLEKITQPVELVASLDDSPKSAQLAELLDEIAVLSDHITVRRADDDERRPSFSIDRVGTDVAVRFAGIPLGHEFTSLVLALLQVGGHPSTAAAELDPADRGARRRAPLRDLLLADLPELPRRGAGAQPDEHPEPEHHPHRDRRRAVPGRGRRPPGHGRADRLPQRRDVRPGPHEPRADRRQARRRRGRARGRPDRRQGPLRRARRRRRTGRRRRRDLRRPQGHPHRRRRRALRRPGARHDGHRELHLRALHRGPQAGHRARAARQGVRRRHHEPAAGGPAGPGRPRPVALVTVELANGVVPALAHRRALHRRPLALDERARRGRVPQQGRHLLPALRRPAVQGQARRGDRRRQLRRRGRHRPGRRRRPRHAARVRHPSAGRRGAAAQAAQPPQRHRHRERPHHRGRRRRRAGHRAGLRGPHHRRGPPGRPRGDLRADRPAAEHRVARGHRRAVAPRRDRDRRPRPHLGAGRVRRRRLHHRALQADRHRHGRRCHRRAQRLRPPHPHQRPRAEAPDGSGIPQDAVA